MAMAGTPEERLRKIIAEQLSVSEEEVVPEASFIDDLNADSLDLVELIMSLEEEFGMEISDEALGNPADYVADDYLHWTVVLRNHAWDNRFVPGREGGQVLTDDLNPVDLWAEDINRVERRDLHRFFGREIPTW